MVGARTMSSEEPSLSNMVLGFFEQIEEEEEENSSDRNGSTWRSDDELEGSSDTKENDKLFWETQLQLLQESLGKRSATENRIRADTEEAVSEINSGAAGFAACKCGRLNWATIATEKYCKNCILSCITERLRDAGYNSALCKSKWRRSPDIPSGEHSYVDVLLESKNPNKSPVRVLIELNFRAEFEMVRASKEYNNLVNTLPEIFVGKSEKLKNVVKVMCGAVKKCMKENRMHVAPWRKHEYMQSKWLATPERLTGQPAEIQKPVVEISDRRINKARASMLTFDLHRTAVTVV